MPRLAPGSIQIPIQWVLKSFSQVVKQAENVANHSLSPTSKVQNILQLYRHSLLRLHVTVFSYAQWQLISVSSLSLQKSGPLMYSKPPESIYTPKFSLVLT